MDSETHIREVLLQSLRAPEICQARWPGGGVQKVMFMAVNSVYFAPMGMNSLGCPILESINGQGGGFEVKKIVKSAHGNFNTNPPCRGYLSHTAGVARLVAEAIVKLHRKLNSILHGLPFTVENQNIWNGSISGQLLVAQNAQSLALDKCTWRSHLVGLMKRRHIRPVGEGLHGIASRRSAVRAPPPSPSPSRGLLLEACYSITIASAEDFRVIRLAAIVFSPS